MNPMVMGPSMFPSDNSPNNQLAGLRMRKRTMVYPGEMVKVGEIFGVKGRYWGQGEMKRECSRLFSIGYAPFYPFGYRRYCNLTGKCPASPAMWAGNFT